MQQSGLFPIREKADSSARDPKPGEIFYLANRERYELVVILQVLWNYDSSVLVKVTGSFHVVTQHRYRVVPETQVLGDDWLHTVDTYCVGKYPEEEIQKLARKEFFC